jgi:integrase
VLRELKLASGDRPLVFGTPSGKPENLANLRVREWGPAQVEAGIVTREGGPRYPGLHSARHFCASWMLARAPEGMGATLSEVQSRLGHSSPVMTLTIYAHLMPRDHSADMIEAQRRLLGSA